MTVSRTLGMVLIAAVTATMPAHSQGYPFSQRGSVQQDVALTSISVTYGRPVARGRALFGALVPWDSVWHPGADSATLVSVNHDVLVEGRALKAGEYSLWLVPREHGPWTLIFNRAAHVFHKPYPGEASDVLRVDESRRHSVRRSVCAQWAARYCFTSMRPLHAAASAGLPHCSYKFTNHVTTIFLYLTEAGPSARNPASA
jgi:hypothetical protein